MIDIKTDAQSMDEIRSGQATNTVRREYLWGFKIRTCREGRQEN